MKFILVCEVFHSYALKTIKGNVNVYGSPIIIKSI
jgi:hypothetical protein